MLASIQHVEFGACERNAISIAIENWTVKSGGQMAAHLKLCEASNEMKMSTACQSFIPLGEAYSTCKSKKIRERTSSNSNPPDLNIVDSLSYKGLDRHIFRALPGYRNRNHISG